jgi:hypothetical protein
VVVKPLRELSEQVSVSIGNAAEIIHAARVARRATQNN